MYLYSRKCHKDKISLAGTTAFSRGRTLGWYYDEPQLRKRIEQYQFLKTGKSGKYTEPELLIQAQMYFRLPKDYCIGRILRICRRFQSS